MEEEINSNFPSLRQSLDSAIQGKIQWEPRDEDASSDEGKKSSSKEADKELNSKENGYLDIPAHQQLPTLANEEEDVVAKILGKCVIKRKGGRKRKFQRFNFLDYKIKRIQKNRGGKSYQKSSKNKEPPLIIQILKARRCGNLSNMLPQVRQSHMFAKVLQTGKSLGLVPMFDEN